MLHVLNENAFLSCVYIQIGRFEVGGSYEIYDMVQKDIVSFQRFSDDEALDNLVKRLSCANFGIFCELVNMLRAKNYISVTSVFKTPIVFSGPSTSSAPIMQQKKLLLPPSSKTPESICISDSTGSSSDEPVQPPKV